MNVVLLLTFVLGVIELTPGFVIQPFENFAYNSKDASFGENISLDLDEDTTYVNDASTTMSITSTEVIILTTLTTIPDGRLETTTPSVLDVTTSDHNVPTTTSVTPTEVTIFTTLSTIPDERLETTTPSVIDDNVTTSDHNVPTTTSVTPTEVTIVTTLTTIPDERTITPSIELDDDDDYHNDCDCPPQFLTNVVKCTCAIQL